MCSVGPRRLAVELLGRAVLRRAHRVLRRPDDTLREALGLQLLVAGDDASGLLEATLDVPARATLLIFIHGRNVLTQGNQARAEGPVCLLPRPLPRSRSRAHGGRTPSCEGSPAARTAESRVSAPGGGPCPRWSPAG